MQTVLVVDDIQTDRTLIGTVVTATGNRAEYASDGAEAVIKAKAIKPALILLDIVMPGQDGFATCRILKKDPATASIPVVMVTVRGSDADRFWAEKQGCDAYVVKPFAPEDLTTVIRRFV